MRSDIELNGVANIKLIVDAFSQTNQDGSINIESFYVASLQENLDTLERYMLAYSEAVNSGVQPPAWHEVKSNKKLFPLNREKR